MGVDITPDMIAAATSQARNRGITNVEFSAIDDERSLRLAQGAFDVVTCRYGLYMPGPVAAVRAWRDALKLSAASRSAVVYEWLRDDAKEVQVSKLIYMTNTSLDGYIEDETGAFDWVIPDQVFAIVTELLKPIGTFFIGRRLHETMTYWDAPVEDYPPEQRDFARIWQKLEKIVFSRTLTGATTRNTRVERDFDVETIRKLKQESAHDICIGGAELAGLALEADLVDECDLFLNPVIVGGGKPAFRSTLRRNLELLETHRFDNGVIRVRYRIRGGTP